MASILYKGKTIINGYWVEPPAPTPGILLWTPEEITTHLWLDAKTESSIVLTDGAVSQWLDLSGNDRHHTQTISGKRPSYTSATSVNFSGSHCLTGDSLGLTTNSFTICTVFKTASSPFQYLWSEGGSTGSVSKGAGIATIDGAYYGLIHDGTRLVFPTNIGSNASDNNRKIRTDKFQRASTWEISADGSILGSASISARNASITQPNPSFIGTLLDSLGYFIGEINELIIIIGNSSTDIEKIEGYLAHKWGTASNLPSGHPYKTNPPVL